MWPYAVTKKIQKKNFKNILGWKIFFSKKKKIVFGVPHFWSRAVFLKMKKMKKIFFGRVVKRWLFHGIKSKYFSDFFFNGFQRLKVGQFQCFSAFFMVCDDTLSQTKCDHILRFSRLLTVHRLPPWSTRKWVI